MARTETFHNMGFRLTYPIVGVPADISEYENTIDSLLAQGSVDHKPSSADGTPAKQNACRVIVTDKDGRPVAGAAVQFCSDTTCMMGKTDAEGTAFFTAEDGAYTVHVQKVPEGYAACKDEFEVPQDFGDVKIILNKA